MPQVLAEQLVFEFGGVGEVAVVRQHDAEGRVDVKRLRLGRILSRAGGRIAHVGQATGATQIAHVAGAKDIAHQARAFVHVEHVVLDRANAGSILTAMLEHLQSVVEQLVDWRPGDHTEDSTHCDVSLADSRPRRSIVTYPAGKGLRQRRSRPFDHLHKPGAALGLAPHQRLRQRRHTGQRHRHQHHQDTAHKTQQHTQHTVGAAQAHGAQRAR